MTATEAGNLVERLSAHRMIGGVPRAELEWLARHGEFRRYESGQTVTRPGELIEEMIIQLSGHVSAFVDRPTGRRHVLTTTGGDVTALLPFSRLTASIAEVLVDETADIVAVNRSAFPEMIRECPGLIETLVHYMVDRARHLASTQWQDEKMMSLGRLAAGLAHELNNPASAAARSAKLLRQALAEAREASQALGAIHMTDAQSDAIKALAERSLIPATTGVFSAMERADHEDVIAEWLAARNASLAPAAAIAESGLTTDALDDIADLFVGADLDAALRWMAAEYTTRTLATDVERATTRIHDLVSAVKRFSYMNRTGDFTPTNIVQGIGDTVAVLTPKARNKSVSVETDLESDLPMVMGNAGDLNQVWSNLLENALDAVDEGGHVTVTAAHDGRHIIVRFVDDGPGIPAEIEGRIFDPFFTTKPIGQGTGLGLDISRRTVQSYDGHIVVESRPGGGHTEFRVLIPIERAGRA
jgi:signal transduction histidine kinase